MSNVKIHHSMLVLVITSILAACGGGESSTPGTTDTTIDAMLQGKAAKGIVINGDVTAKELDSAGTVLRDVGSAITGPDGKYELDLSATYEGGPILIQVTNGINTTMVCDATSGCGSRTDSLPDNNNNALIDFGEQYKPASLSMTALLPDAEDGETIDVQITPFTNMAAEKALNSGILDNASINAANSEVSALLGGVDILRTEPVDITNPANLANADAVAVTYAALTASIAEIAGDDANGQPDIDQALAELATGFSGGTFAAADMQAILDGATDALAEVGAMDTSGLIAEIQSDVTDAIANSSGVIDPVPNTNVGDSDVELAKAFIADLRTWGTVIGNELDAPADAFETQLDMTSEASDMLDDGTGDAISAGADAIGDLIDGVLMSGSALTGYATDYGSFTAGTISQTPVTGGIEYSIAGASVDTAQGSSTLDMVLVAPAEGTQESSIVFGVRSITAEGSAFRWVVDSGTLTAFLSTPYDVDFGLEDAPTPDVSSVVFDFDLAVTQKQTLGNNNQPVVAMDPVTFSGNLTTTIYPITDSNGEISDGVPGSFVLGGMLSNTTGDSFEASFTVSIPNADSITSIDETQQLIGNVGLNFTAQFDGLPLATIALTGNVTAFETGNANVTISYGPRQLVFTVSNETGTDTGSINITNQDGVEMLVEFDNLEDDLSPNDITINNRVIATIQDLDNGATKISYIDGTFEIF